jgi:hypothetical protein
MGKHMYAQSSVMHSLVRFIVLCTVTAVYVAGTLQSQQPDVEFEKAKQFLVTRLLDDISSFEPNIIPLELLQPVKTVKTAQDGNYVCIVGHDTNNMPTLVELIFDQKSNQYTRRTIVPNIIDWAISKDAKIVVQSVTNVAENAEWIEVWKDGSLFKSFYPFTETPDRRYMLENLRTSFKVYPTLPSKRIKSITLSNFGDFCIVQSEDNTIQFFDTATGEILYETEHVIMSGINDTGNAIFALCRGNTTPETYVYKIFSRLRKPSITRFLIPKPELPPTSYPDAPLSIFVSAALNQTGDLFAYISGEVFCKDNKHCYQELHPLDVQRAPLFSPQPIQELPFITNSFHFLSDRDDIIQSDMKGPIVNQYNITKQKALSQPKPIYIEIEDKQLTLKYTAADLSGEKIVSLNPGYSFVTKFDPQIFRYTNVIALVTDPNKNLYLWYCDLLQSHPTILPAINNATSIQKDTFKILYRNKMQEKNGIYGSAKTAENFISTLPEALHEAARNYFSPSTPPVAPLQQPDKQPNTTETASRVSAPRPDYTSWTTLKTLPTTIWKQSATLLSRVSNKLRSWWQKVYLATQKES